MHSYDPLDDEPAVEEQDTEYYRPDPDDDEIDWTEYDAWLATLPRQTVTHSCGHSHAYAVADGLPLPSAAHPCWDCRKDDLPPYDDPFSDEVGA